MLDSSRDELRKYGSVGSYRAPGLHSRLATSAPSLHHASMNIKCIYVLLFLGLTSFLSTLGRTFQNKTGTKLDADLVDVDPTHVLLKRRADGQVFRVAIESLSLSDQEFITICQKDKAGLFRWDKKPVNAPNASGEIIYAELPFMQVWHHTRPPRSWLATRAGWLYLKLPKIRGAVSGDLVAKHPRMEAKELRLAGAKFFLEHQDFIFKSPAFLRARRASYLFNEDRTMLEFGIPLEKDWFKKWPTDEGRTTLEVGGFMPVQYWHPDPEHRRAVDNQKGLVKYDLMLEGETQADGTFKGKAKGAIVIDHNINPLAQGALQAFENLVFEDVDFIFSRIE